MNHQREKRHANYDELRENFPEMMEEARLSYPPGWHSIIYNLCQGIKDLGRMPAVVQVKEKFAGMRFYYDAEGPRDEIQTLVKQAEARAKNTCQECGTQPAERRGVDGWTYTLCDNCYQNAQDQ